MTVVAADELPDRDELVALYAAVGWTAYTRDPETLAAGMAGADLVVIARGDDGRLVGLLRAVSDGATIAYLQDVLVHPDHRRRGIGRALVEAFLDRYAHVRQRVLLTDDEPGQHAFYSALGFERADRVAGGPLRAFVAFTADPEQGRGGVAAKPSSPPPEPT